MRKPKYLSPTALNVWEKNQEDFYLQYLADERPPRFPQTQAMAVGSAFDAYVKAYLFERLFGKTDPKFELEQIFIDQVEEQNRDWALTAGEHAFDAYKNSGALADLLRELEKSQCEPKFEFTLRGEVGGVPLLGKPDVWYIHKDGTPVILDFKVNGFCSKRAKSPARGYLRLRDGYGKHKKANQSHKDCTPMEVDNFTLNVAEYFECIDKTWGLQLSTYAWLQGAEVGDHFAVAIDQLACSPNPVDKEKPFIVIAEHRGVIGKDFQETVVKRYQTCWNAINSGHILLDRSREESVERCRMLDMQHEAYKHGGDFLREMTGRI